MSGSASSTIVATFGRFWSATAHHCTDVASGGESGGAALSEIVGRIEAGVIKLVLHWQGGATGIEAQDQRRRQASLGSPGDTSTLVRELARLMPDRQIAQVLNRAGKPTGRGNGWTPARVCSFRSR
ncbi:hypothetical protein [Mesorhizobium sp. M1403]|uniref:hypothetical protein n=1 Tax=Mesorhizobium sp. M1403 TaxID=2957097 RepID=UPI00333D872A